LNRWPLQVRQVDGLTTVEGYAAVFYRQDDPGTEYELWDGSFERIKPTAFDRALAEQDDIRALFNHDPSVLLGRTRSNTLELWVDDTGLGYRTKIDHDDPDHQRVIAKLRRGDLTGSSFAFTIDEGGMDVERKGKIKIRHLTSLHLYDVGPVTYPAYKGTQASVRSDLNLTKPDDWQRIGEVSGTHSVYGYVWPLSSMGYVNISASASAYGTKKISAKTDIEQMLDYQRRLDAVGVRVDHSTS